MIERLDLSRLWIAFVASLLLHLTCYGVYKGGQRLGIWERLHWTPVSTLADNAQDEPLQLFTEPTGEPPMMFVDVNPAVATTEPPEDTRFYSDQNSRAANPLTESEGDLPKFDGTQKDSLRTEDVPLAKTVPLEPAIPPVAEVEVPAEPKPQPRPEPAPPTESLPEKGDLTLARAEPPAEEAPPAQQDQPKPRPRTLKEAMARLPEAQVNRLPGRKMQQEGGVRRLATLSSLDVKASPFGDYDKAIIIAIQNRWYDLLDMRGFGYERSGKVVVEFRLHYDGRVSDLRVTEHTVDEMLSLLCQKAVLDPAPYAHWPSDMRRMVGQNYRDVCFTFYYN